LSNFISLLLQEMIDPDAEKRPSAIGLMRHPLLSPLESMPEEQLRNELKAERLQNEILIKRLQISEKTLKSSAARV
jgi:serine/threonine protein kinase